MYVQGLDICQVKKCLIFSTEGRFNGSFHIYTWTDMESANSDVQDGGIWKPPDCVAREEVAIIIPMMGREKHLRILLSVLHPFLQRQQISYRIYVAEQV